MDIPTVGRIVHYILTRDNAEQINRRRTNSASIRERSESGNWPEGAQAHIGNSASVGDVMPMIVVRVWPNEFGTGVPGVNGQVFLDGNDSLWVTSIKQDEREYSGDTQNEGTWHWPKKV